MRQRSISAPFYGPVAEAEAEAVGKQSALEREVIEMFEQFRDRILRYLLAMGLGVQDGEEVVQEVFLALFQHLRMGKSRRNLRAWVFRVAHNLGLKQRCRNHRERS
ncbi:MAG: hypothetical protein JO022_07730, partial [Acidobacteriaceae bacterium]|nr:hypothetical protein [Acidobacteriaceae bacterium]